MTRVPNECNMSARSCKNQLHKSIFCVKLLPHFGNKGIILLKRKQIVIVLLK